MFSSNCPIVGFYSFYSFYSSNMFVCFLFFRGFFFFFDVDHFNVLTESVTILLLFYVSVRS